MESEKISATYGTIWMNFEELGRAAAAAQIEPRYPYVDKRLVEFCIALPSGQRLWQGWTRAIQRRAMQGVVPDEICWRTNKAQFVGMFAQSLRTRGRQVLADTIENTPEHLARYFNLPVLRDRCRRFLAGDDELTVDVWRAANTIRWMAHSELAQIATDQTTQAQGVHA